MFLTYEVLSEYYGRFDSLRANEVINIVETVFWMAAVPISLMGLNHCSATGCVIIGVIVFIVTLLLYVDHDQIALIRLATPFSLTPLSFSMTGGH